MRWGTRFRLEVLGPRQLSWRPPLDSRANELAPSSLTEEGWGGGEIHEHTRIHWQVFTSPQPYPETFRGFFVALGEGDKNPPPRQAEGANTKRKS